MRFFNRQSRLLDLVTQLRIVMSPDTHHVQACGYDVTHVWRCEGSFLVRRIHARLNNPDKAISSPITSPTNIHFCLGDAFGPLS
jgi:hypothetical protein